MIGTPDRLASLRGALDGVTIACWMLATAEGDAARVRALHGSRLESFLGQAIDTTMRGFVYEAGGLAPVREALSEGERIVRTVAERNAIPTAIIRADVAADPQTWQVEAWAAISGLLEGRGGAGDTLSSS